MEGGPVKIELVAGDTKSIWLQSSYSPQNYARCKFVGEGVWHKEEKVWGYPLSIEKCRKMREVFKDRLVIGPLLNAWAKQAIVEAAALKEMHSKTSFPLSVLEISNPTLWAAMQARPYQSVGVEFAKTVRTALIADQPGLGKTLETIGAFHEAQVTGTVLVFAPLTAILSTWPGELARWAEKDKVSVAYGSKLQRESIIDNAILEDIIHKDNGTIHWVLCNIEMARAKHYRETRINRNDKEVEELRWEWQYPALGMHAWSGIVVDESHRALICRSSKRTDHSQARAGLGMIKTSDDALRIALSGTPMRGKPENFWGTLNWLRPDEFTSYWKWVDQWFSVYTDTFTDQTVLDGIDPAKEAEMYASLARFMIRRTKAEVAPDLPEKQYNEVWLPMEGKQAKAYKQMQESAIAKLDDGDLMATGVLAEMTRAKQFASSYGKIETNIKVTDGYSQEDHVFRPSLPSNKYDWLLQFLTDRGIAGDQTGTSKVVVASQFTQLIELIAAALTAEGVEVVQLTGKTKATDRPALQKRFQAEGGPRVFLLNTHAGGVSLTLDAADDLVILDETYIPDDQEQVEDRIHRVSRVHQVSIWYVRSQGSIEEGIAKTTNDRENIQKSLIDGQRGVAFARELLGY